MPTPPLPLPPCPGTTRVGQDGKLFVRGGAAFEPRTYLDGLLVQSPYGRVVPARSQFAPRLFKGVLQHRRLLGRVRAGAERRGGPHVGGPRP